MVETMNAAEIAEMLRLKRQTVTERIVRLPDFPKPWFGRIASHRLWRKEDVLAWVTQSREAMSSDDVR